MCRIKLKLISVCLVLLIVVIPNYAKLKQHRKDKILPLVLRDIILQNNLKGLFIINASHRGTSRIVQPKINDIVRQAAKLTTVAYIFLKTMKYSRYIVEIERYAYNISYIYFKRELAARENIFVLAMFPILRLNEIARQITKIDEIIPSSQSMTKMVIVTFVPKKCNGVYREIFEKLSKAYVYNVDVLEIIITPNSLVQRD